MIKPIKISLKEMGLEDKTIIIFHGKTEAEMYKMMKPMIDPLKTIIHDDNSPNN